MKSLPSICFNERRHPGSSFFFVRYDDESINLGVMIAGNGDCDLPMTRDAAQELVAATVEVIGEQRSATVKFQDARFSVEWTMSLSTENQGTLNLVISIYEAMDLENYDFEIPIRSVQCLLEQLRNAIEGKAL